LKKIGEEATEFVTACADSDAGRAVEEAADIVYHMAVALEALDTSLDAVATVLFERSADANRAAARVSR
jgi:phosphoribosyl-ATP pyrophosphohydrolase/phosphoribosyl-AMP cyclohydrolase